MKNFCDLLGNTLNEFELSKIPFFNEIASKAKEDIIATRLSILNEASELLFEKKSYSVKDFVDHGFIEFLIECLKMSDDDLLCEAAWNLSTIAFESSDYCNMTIQCGAVPVLINLFESSDSEVRCHSFNLLGALLQRYPLSYTEYMELELHDKLISAVYSFPSLNEWTYLSSVIGVCQPNQELLKLTEEYLFNLEEYFPTKNQTILEEISEILNNLCIEEKELCQMVLKSGILEKLIPFLNVSGGEFSNTIMSTFVSIAQQLKFNELIIETGILNVIAQLLLSFDDELIEDITLFLVFLGTDSESIQAMIDANIIPALIEISEGETKKREAILTLQYLMYEGSPEQAMKIIKMNVFPSFSDCLEYLHEELVIQRTLETLFNVLQKSAKSNVKLILEEMVEYGYPDKIKLLQDHSNEKIKELSIKLVEIYFQAARKSIEEESDFEFV